MGSVEAPTRLTGGCQCGAVRYELTARPRGASICHCRMCQKAGGAPFMAFTGGVRQEHFVFTRGEPAIYRSSEIAERGFCAFCGTPLTYRLIGRDRISVTIGSLDQPGRSCADASNSASNPRCPGSPASPRFPRRGPRIG